MRRSNSNRSPRTAAISTISFAAEDNPADRTVKNPARKGSDFSCGLRRAGTSSAERLCFRVPAHFRVTVCFRLPDHFGRRTISGHRIVSAAAPRVTARQPSQGEPRAFQQTVFAQGFQRVLRAGRRKPARRGRERRDAELVELHQCDQRQGADTLKDAPRPFPESAGLHLRSFYRTAPPSKSRSAPDRD